MEQPQWDEWRETRGTTSNLFEQEESPFPIRHAIVTDVLQERSTVFGFDLLPSDPIWRMLICSSPILSVTRFCNATSMTSREYVIQNV